MCITILQMDVICFENFVPDIVLHLHDEISYIAWGNDLVGKLHTKATVLLKLILPISFKSSYIKT